MNDYLWNSLAGMVNNILVPPWTYNLVLNLCSSNRQQPVTIKRISTTEKESPEEF